MVGVCWEGSWGHRERPSQGAPAVGEEGPRAALRVGLGGTGPEEGCRGQAVLPRRAAPAAGEDRGLAPLSEELFASWPSSGPPLPLILF